PDGAAPRPADSRPSARRGSERPHPGGLPERGPRPALEPPLQRAAAGAPRRARTRRPAGPRPHARPRRPRALLDKGGVMTSTSTIAQHDLILAGRRTPGAAEPIDVVYPYTGEVIARVGAAARADVERAIEAAEATFRLYRDEPAHRRSSLLHAVSARIAERREELAREITYETGKAIWECRLECDRAVTTFRIAAEEATRIDGEIVPLDGVPAGQGRLGEVRRFPIGPVAAITPFNSPFNLVAHKVAPALAAGNTIVVKPASATPLSGLNVGALVTEAAEELGLPGGLISVLPCSPDAAEPLVTDPRIRGLSFTGSSPVGWALRARAGQKKVSLELGGNGAVIVHDDGDVALAAERVSFGGYLLAGQVC